MDHIANLLLNIEETSDDRSEEPRSWQLDTTAVGSVLDNSGSLGLTTVKCAGDEFDLDNEKGLNECW